MFIEVHILQSFSPANLNRDDTGNPKDTEFGGVRRARISSQCIKRAIRLHPAFREETQVDLAVRTRWITRLLVEPLTQRGKDPQEAQEVAEALAAYYCSKIEKGRTSVLLYMSRKEINTAVEKLLARWDEIVSALSHKTNPVLEQLAKEMVREFRNRTSAPDIALFGRMLADKPELNIDASCQVAHAISTHRVSMEMDFYTAVDDLARDEETGAGMMGLIPFNSACFYRYARVDWEQLVHNLGGDTDLARKSVRGFLRACVLTVPTGKQNSFAAQNPPDFLLGVSRFDGQSWSLANAFEVPVRPARDGGLIVPSIARLDEYWHRVAKAYGDQRLKPVVLCLAGPETLTHLRDFAVEDLSAWVDTLMATLPV